MYLFTIEHKTGSKVEYENIIRVEYFIAGMEEVIEGEEIGTHKFPNTTNLYLFSDNSSYLISGQDILNITIQKEL